MKQILQNLKTGMTEIADVPCPQIKAGYLLIQTKASLVSAGTEKMLVEFAKANLFDKARQQPDKVRQVIQKIKTDGLLPTIETVHTKLDQPLPLGYCNAGMVIEVGKGVEGFNVGDRVVSNGPHAEVVCVPKNLCAKIPTGVADEEAAFTVLASISLQGIRLAKPTLGETFVVTGLGLIGLITVQLLKAHGCKVIGIDLDEYRLKLASRFGAEVINIKTDDPLAKATAMTNGRGVDGVLITAATKSSEPVHQAAQMCRKRGRIVLVGVTGLELSRADFYEKELTFQVSCSYGPGRYDPLYEEKGIDYPLGFVRWTEQRNFEAILDMLADKRLDVTPLISHRFDINNAAEAYELLNGKGPSLGIIITYPQVEYKPENDRIVSLETGVLPSSMDKKIDCVVGVIGAGNFTGMMLLPALKKTSAVLKTIASEGGVSSVYNGRKFGFQESTTDVNKILDDPEINTVFITTRHDTHAEYVIRALEHKKHIFVEKPLCINKEELYKLEKPIKSSDTLLTVGFNRRFSPLTRKVKELLDSVSQPKSFIMTVNAGEVPPGHWTQSKEIGGGRIIGEGCHFIDLLRYLVGARITGFKASMMGNSSGVSIRDDKMTITLEFEDGSFGTVHYFANGHKSFPKERLEVFSEGKILVLDNFKKLIGYGWPGFSKMSLWKQDKGHANGVAEFVTAVRENKPSPISIDEILEVTRISIDIIESVY